MSEEDQKTDSTSKIQLGAESLYPDRYDANLLEPIPRDQSRSKLVVDGEELPFAGTDYWTAYEVSWLNSQGLPQVAIAEFDFPAESKNIVESKSFKYYLNSFNKTEFKTWAKVTKTLSKDLSTAVSAEVKVKLFTLEEGLHEDSLTGKCVDKLDVKIDTYQVNTGYLQVVGDDVRREQLYSHLLKSNCPVTGQPDWATVWIEYNGNQISEEGFLKYIVSFRDHQDFHENCVEKIFTDILERCSPRKLSVYARYTRRGGLDINPYRTNCNRSLPFKRLSRQ